MRLYGVRAATRE